MTYKFEENGYYVLKFKMLSGTRTTNREFFDINPCLYASGNNRP